MKFAVTHSTTYTYSRPVRLQRHVMRLRPRSDGALKLLRFDLEIEPRPARFTECLDLEGNCVAHAWFQGSTPRLSIISKFEIETLRENPFDYFLDESARALPPHYPDLNGSIAAYCIAKNHEKVAAFAHELAEHAGRRTLDFLEALNTRIYETCPRFIRETGAPQAPEVTLEQRHGSCRDLAVLFMEACRVVGIAARFASGYQRYGRNPAKRYMHAWPEVYLPGGGWRGYDPTHGLAVADLHVAVAASRASPGAAPISGGFCGDGVSSKMEARVEIG